MTQTIPTLNTDHLLGLLAWAETEDTKRRNGKPSEWDQESWIAIPLEIEDKTYYPDKGVTPPEFVLDASCGTACCLAGKASFDAGARPALIEWTNGNGFYLSTTKVTVPGKADPVSVRAFAQQQLGLLDEEASTLFAGGNNIEDLRVLIPAIIARDYDLTDDEEIHAALSIIREKARSARDEDDEY